ncbi:hypothetical protein EDM59_04195 [Brevibacillus nitrificans]|uniref:Uncharacterized protein n=1 Tax=Brevibacillus nitrificans TaxID=651560 RepID=A0A3M8DJY8_9BACL|nr:hypothetical protein [Brevibacillus nitrificans]RNB88334.1 hypothetical protein EDM59_04195 [Brevibacillus nitrificans]
MTMSKKGTRRIVVGQESYRWAVSPASNSKGLLVLTVEHTDYQGQLIRVYIESDRNEYWLEFPKVEKLTARAIKPADVSEIISQAVSFGWDPKRKGPPLSFLLVGTQLKLKNT